MNTQGTYFQRENTEFREQKVGVAGEAEIHIPDIVWYGTEDWISLWTYRATSCRMLPCVPLFMFDLICHANILIHLCTAGGTAFITWHYTDSLETALSSIPSFHQKWEEPSPLFRFNVQLLACHTAIWRNMLLLCRNANSTTFTAILWKSSGKLQ